MTNTAGTTITLNNGIDVPLLGLGVVVDAINWALEPGYRVIDTAACYGIGEGVAEAIRNNRVPREHLFVTAKVWNSAHMVTRVSIDSGERNEV